MMTVRFLSCLVTAILWAVVAVWWLPLGWVLIGATVIGILFTVGVEPPRRSFGSETLGQRERRAEPSQAKAVSLFGPWTSVSPSMGIRNVSLPKDARRWS